MSAQAKEIMFKQQKKYPTNESNIKRYAYRMDKSIKQGGGGLIIF